MNLEQARKFENLGWKAAASVLDPGNYYLAKKIGCYDLLIRRESPRKWTARLTHKRPKSSVMITMEASNLRSADQAKRWLDHQMYWMEEC